MPDVPAAALLAAALAIHRAACPLRDDPDHDCARDAAHEEMLIPRARAALEAAAPILAGEIAQKITEYAAEHEPDARTAEEMMRRSAWRGHFHTAAHIALGRPLCANCALPVMPLAASSTGWTHDSGSPVEGWQGVRCPGRLCGATPVREDEGS